MMQERRDVFLSHASEDKSKYVRPLAQELDKAGISYWLDEAEIKWGDSFTRKINEGLGKSKFVIVFLSDHFLQKKWPEVELNTALNMGISSGKTIVLPLLISNPNDVFKRYPLLQGKTCVNWNDGIPNIIEQLKAQLGRDPHQKKDHEQVSNQKNVLIDLSHQQNEWITYAPLIKNHPGLQFRDQKQAITTHDLENASVLVVAPPYHCELTNNYPIQDIEQWVAGGGRLLLLGYYFVETHHENNFNDLARALGFEFSNDLIMPVGRTSFVDCRDQAFEYDEDLSVSFQIPSDESNPIIEGVQKLSFLSACSINRGSLPKPKYLIKTPKSSIVLPEGRPSRKGYLLQVTKYDDSRMGAATVLAAWPYGLGKLVAVGTWKVATFDFGDNFVLVENIFNWLGQATN